MAALTFTYGAILLILGLVGYFGSDAQSITALIPAFFGLPILGLAVMAQNPDKKKLAMHIIVTLALLGFAGSVGGLYKWFLMMGGTIPERPEAVKAQAIMAAASLVYMVFAIKSFIDVRRAK